MVFPTIVYRDGGSCHRPGGMYSWACAKDQPEFDELIADGWVAAITDIDDDAPEIDAPKRRGRKPKA